MYLLFIVADNIKPNDIIWAKYDRYPYWPALVSYNGNNVNVNIQALQLVFEVYVFLIFIHPSNCK